MKVGPDAGAGADLMPLLGLGGLCGLLPPLQPPSSTVSPGPGAPNPFLEPLADDAEPVRLHYAARSIWICRESGLSFSPEKAQIELACDAAADSVSVPGGPITSPAKAVLHPAPARAAVQTATASVNFLRWLSSPS